MKKWIYKKLIKYMLKQLGTDYDDRVIFVYQNSGKWFWVLWSNHRWHASQNEVLGYYTKGAVEDSIDSTFGQFKPTVSYIHPKKYFGHGNYIKSKTEL